VSDPPAGRHGTADAHVSEHARFGPFAALVIAALARFHGLGARTLWTDEGSTWTAASLPLHALIRRCVERDASPPLYYLLTAWAIRGHDDEWHLRLVSALASLLLVALTYRIARLGLGRSASTLAAMLTALSPFQVMYAQEARTYTLVAALLVAATWAYARLLRGDRGAWWSYVAATALGLWTQSIAALGVATQGALAMLTPAGRRKLLPWLGGLAVAGAIYLPWAWYGRGVSEHLSSSHWYVPDTDALGIFKLLRAALLSPLPLVTAPPGSTLHGLDAWMPRPIAWAVVAIPPLLALALSLPELARPDGRGLLARVAWAGWAVPVAAVFAASLRHPLFLTRYFVFVTPFVSALVALGLTRVRWAPPRVLLSAWLVALALLGLARYEHDYSKEPWRDVAAAIGREALPGRTAVLVPFDVDPFAYYDRRLPHPVAAFEVGHPAEPFAAHYTPRQIDDMERAAGDHVARYDDVWVIVRSPNSEVRREVARRTEAVAAQGRALVTRTRWDSFTGPLRVTHWRRDSTASAATAR